MNRTLQLFSSFLFFLFFFTVKLIAQPLNDNCANAISVPVNLTCGTLESANTASATMDNPNPGYSCWSSSNDDDIWYTFTTPSVANDVTINVSNYTFTPFDPGIGFGLFTACSGTPDVSGGACQFNPVNGTGSYTFYNLLPNTTYYLALLTPGTGVSIAFDFCLTYTLCPPPTNLYITNKTMSSVDVNWSGTNTYILEYGLAGFTPGSGNTPGVGGTIISPATSPQNISGLTQTTPYDIYIRNDCNSLGNGYSADAFIAVTTSAPPAVNDDCINAIALATSTSQTCNTLVSAHNTGCTISSEPPPTCAYNTENDVWFTFVATASGQLLNITNVLPVDPNSYYNYIGATLYSGTCGSFTEEACDEYNAYYSYGSQGNNPMVLPNLTIGSTYYLRLWAPDYYSSPEATFDICITELPPPPANDDCAGVVTLTPSGSAACGTPTQGTLTSATASVGPVANCGDFDDDVWYEFTATTNTHAVQLNYLNGPSSDYAFQVLDACGPVANEIVCSDPEYALFTNLNVGNQYYVRVATFGSAAQLNDFEICITTPPPPPANDNCANAIVVPVNITCGTLESANTANATMDNPSPGYNCWSSSNDDDIWYTFTTPSVANDVTIDVSNYTFTPYDPGIGFGLFTGCSGTPDVSGGGCQFYPSGGTGTYTFYNLLPNTTYYLSLLTPGNGVSIAFDFCLTYTLCPPPTNLFVTNRTMSSADINWSGTNTYIVEYGPQGFTPGSGTTPGVGGTIISPATSPQNISGLTQTSPYDVYVRNDCSALGNGYSADAFISFNTTAPPAPNDDCINATALSTSTSQTCTSLVSADNIGCTVSSEPIASCAYNADNDVWFTFVATASAQLLDITNVLNVDPNSYYNYIGATLYSGVCGSFTEEACDAYNAYYSYGSQGNNPMVLPNLTVGNTYYLRLWSSDYYSSPEATFDICITEMPPPPSNDDCAGVITLTPSGSIACGTPTQGTLTSATPSAGPTANCGDFADDVWYEFTATTNTHGVQLNYLNGSTSDYAFQVLDACGPVANEIGCSDPEYAVFTNLVVGNMYYVRVASYSNVAQITDFEICITTPPPPPVNDNCVNAISVPIVASCGVLESANTASATMDNPNPGYSCWSSSNDDDIWYTFTTPSGITSVTLDVSNYAFTPNDPGIGYGLFTGCSGTPDVSGGNCQFNPVNGVGSFTFSNLSQNTTYYLALLTPGNGVSISFDFCLTNANVLAIKLDKIAATSVGAANRVDWNTLSEEKGDMFELQRSRDGKSFNAISKIDAKGTASRYTYMDNTAEKGTNFYRLMMRDINGKTTYSEIVKAVVKSATFGVEAFPNPVSDILTIKVNGVSGRDATVQVTDITGKIMKTITMSGTESTINMSGLANGIYLIKYSDTDHKQTVRVTKQ